MNTLDIEPVKWYTRYMSSSAENGGKAVIKGSMGRSRSIKVYAV